MPVEQHVLKAFSPLQMPGFDSSSNNLYSPHSYLSLSNKGEKDRNIS